MKIRGTVLFWLFIAVICSLSFYGRHYEAQEEQRHDEAVRAASEMVMNEYLGQPKPFKKLDDGHYTVLAAVHRTNLSLVKFNLPNGDIILLVEELPADLAKKKYFSKRGTSIAT